MSKRLKTANGEPTVYAMQLGDIIQRGNLSLSYRHGAYILIGYDKNNKHVNKGYRTKTEGMRALRKKA